MRADSSDLVVDAPTLAALRRAVELLGGQSHLARALGVRQSNVWYWLNRAGAAPADYCAAIEKATEGRVTRQELRPDLFEVAPGVVVVKPS